MPCLIRPLTAATFVLMSGGQAALADVSAADVWGDWRDYLTGLGYAVSGTEAQSGDTLTVSDVTIDMTLGAEGGTAKMQLGTLGFTDQGDGTVAVMLPAVMPIEFFIAPPGEDSMRVSLDYAQSGFAMVASGTPTELTYDYSADSIGMTLTGLEVAGQPVAAEDAAASFTMGDVTGTTTTTIAALRSYDQSFEAGSVRYNVQFNDPKGEGTANIVGRSNGMGFDGLARIPLQVVPTTNMDEMLAAGFAMDGMFTYAGGSSDIAITGPDGPFSGTTASQGGSLGVKMSEEGLSYDATQTGLAVNMTAAAAPLPIAFEVGEARFNLTTPLQKSDTAQDFAFGFALGDFTMSDIIWGIFDPAAQLPRDPATIAVGLTGKAKVLFNILDPQVAAALQSSDTVPGELEALSINKLQVTAAGADLTGTGAFTFDNTAEFNGMPKPTGGMDLRLVGGNKLIDTLVAMGLLPEEQAMGARMMMGLFAVPGDAPDTLNSKIEINDQGHVLANGQRIQ